MMVLFRVTLFTILLTLVNSCANLASAPDKAQLTNFKHAYIVHLGDPPIGVDPAFKQVITGPLKYLGPAQLINSIAALSNLSESFKQAEIMSKVLTQELNAKEPWRPTLQLANIAAKQIESTNLTVAIADNPLKLADNTNKAINAWYNQDGSVTAYRNLSADQTTYVLEIFESNLVYPTALMLEIRMKLIDPASSAILGRVRKWEMVDLPEAELTFKDNGLIYKETLLATGHKLIQKSLNYLGLVQ
jgi:hypothetical protein